MCGTLYVVILSLQIKSYTLYKFLDQIFFKRSMLLYSLLLIMIITIYSL